MYARIGTDHAFRRILEELYALPNSIFDNAANAGKCHMLTGFERYKEMLSIS